MRNFAAVAVAMLVFSVPCQAGDPIRDEGKLWNSLDQTGRQMYVMGVQDGIVRAIGLLFNQLTPKNADGLVVFLPDGTLPTPKEVTNLINVAAIKQDLSKIIEVMNDLYKNPANSYVPLEDMVYIANGALEGEDVNGKLQAARKKAVETRELNKRMPDAKRAR